MSRKLFPILILLLFFGALFALSCQVTDEETFLVAKVIDGDTIQLDNGVRLRYIGIDTPEVGQRYYHEARTANEELVLGKKVRLEKDQSDRDRYNRLLRYVYVNGTFVNAELIKMGLAKAKAYPPDTKYQKEFETLEKQAILNGRGLWSLQPSLPGAR